MGILSRKKRHARPISNRTARQRKVMFHKTLARKRQHKLQREKHIKQVRLSKLNKKKVTCIENQKKIKKENRAYLNLKRKYFDDILSGIETEDSGKLAIFLKFPSNHLRGKKCEWCSYYRRRTQHRADWI